jgi:hypothetical protein
MTVTIRHLRLERPTSKPLDQCPVSRPGVLRDRDLGRGRPGSNRRHLPRQDSVLPLNYVPKWHRRGSNTHARYGHPSLSAARLPASATVPCAVMRELPARSPSGSGWNRTTAHAFVGRRSVPLSCGPWGVRRESFPPRETGRARTGTYPGHNRALYPVKLRPPRLTVRDSQRLLQSGSSRFRACDLRWFKSPLLPPELQSHRV